MLTEQMEDTILELAKLIKERRREALRCTEEAVEERLKRGDDFKDSELIYAAYTRCDCGEGMAYPKNIGMHGYWDCAGILTGRAIPKTQGGSVKHSAQLPFMFYELKSEQQPSARGATTRPGQQAPFTTPAPISAPKPCTHQYVEANEETPSTGMFRCMLCKKVQPF